MPVRMGGIFKGLISGVILSVGLATQAHAVERGPHYILPKLVAMNIFTANPKVDWLFGGGLLYGYSVTPFVAAEVDFNYAGIGGAYRSATEQGDYQLWTLGAYAAARQPFGKRAYGKAKLGFLYEDIQKNNDLAPKSSQVVSLSAGIGGGWVAGQVFGTQLTLEAEYIQIERDVGTLTLATHFAF